MKETRFFFVPQAASAGVLPDDEAAHAQRVLRLKDGDELMLMDGEGSFFRAELDIVGSAVTVLLRHCPSNGNGQAICIWLLPRRR